MGATFNSFGFNGGGTGGGGSPGPPGTPGSVWRNGTGAPAPSLGINGDYYLDDATGIVYTKVAGVYQPVANIDGTDGTDGSVWYNGVGAPSPSPSFNPNDYYLDNSNGDVYVYDGSSWNSPITNIDGANGTNGSVWYAANGFPPPAGTYFANDFYLDNDDGQVYQYDGTNWVQQINIKGASGTQWFTGVGAPSTLEANGDFYLDGTTGDVYEQVANVWTPTGTNIKGANGTNGTDGSIWYSGAVYPPTSPPIYKPTDYFLNTTNGDVYQYDGSTWQFQLTLSGVAGSTWYNGNGAPFILYNDGDYFLDDLTGDVYTQISGVWTPTANIKGPAGANGVDGQDGSSSSYFFYRTKTTSIIGDPLATHVRWNQTAQTTSTELGISVETDDTVDISIFLKLLQIGDNIIIQEKDNSANYQTWEVSAPITDNTTWVSAPVTFVSGGGTGLSNFANNLQVIVAITREGVPGVDGANSTRYGFDNLTVPNTPPSLNRFNADASNITGITQIGIDVFNVDNINFYGWLSTLNLWFSANPSGSTYNILQIREIGNTNVIGTYQIVDIKDFTTWFSLSLVYNAGSGTLDPSKEYAISYSLVGADGVAGTQGVNAANNTLWMLDTTAGSLGNFSCTPSGFASAITSFDVNDISLLGNEFNWLEYARTTSLTGAAGILTLASISFPNNQCNFTINSIVDNGGTHTFNVSFLGGFNLDFSSLSSYTFGISYVFNGAGGVGGTIGVYYPNISTPIDLATNTMVFTGSGVNVTQISPSDVQIDITGNSNGSIVSSIRSLSTSTTLSPFVVGAITIPYNGTITGWTIFSDVSGSCTVDFKSSSYGSYPPTASIFSGNAPNLVSAVKNQLTGLSIAVTQGDVLLCDLTAISGTMSRIDVTLLITKS